MRMLSWMLGCCLLAAVGVANAATQVLFETNQGNFAVEVYADKAPKTVENFLQYVKDGFYTNTIFHRVIGRFMIQGGGFDRELAEKPTRAPVVNEAGNGLVNQTGTIAMARTQDPNSATAQFLSMWQTTSFWITAARSQTGSVTVCLVKWCLVWTWCLKSAICQRAINVAFRMYRFARSSLNVQR